MYLYLSTVVVVGGVFVCVRSMHVASRAGLNRSNMRLLGCCRAGRRVAKRAQDIDQEDIMSDDDDEFDSDVSDKIQEPARAKFPNEEPIGASVNLVYADLDIECLEQGRPSAPTVQKYEPTQYVEFSAYKADVIDGNIKTDVNEYGNINMTDKTSRVPRRL